MTNNPEALRAAADALNRAAAMLEHNDGIFKGKWKKGSKAWSGDFIERTVSDGLALVGAARITASATERTQEKNMVYNITVNGESKQHFGDAPISYEDVLRLAGYAPERVISVTYTTSRKGDEQRQGSLRKGQNTRVEEGMRFNAYDTSNA